MRRLFHIFAFLLTASMAPAQEPSDTSGVRLLKGVEYAVEMSGTVGTGDHAPLWLHSNRYGLPSAETSSGYLRGGLFRSTHADSLRQWRLGYGVDLAVAANHTSAFIIHQFYGDVDWKHGRLTVGAKEQPMQLKNNALSSGSQTLGINARPIPQVRIELPEYWVVPYTKGWVQLKGHLAYGMMTDDHWQHDFTGKRSRYTDHVLYHSKAGYLRIKNDDYDYPLSLEMGLEMASQFGGTTYMPTPEGDMRQMKNGTGLKSFWHAFVPGGSDSYEKNGVYQNEEGNHLGSYLIRVNYDKRDWSGAVYFERFFEDQSGMFGIDYDGYGDGEQWDKRKRHHYLLYDFKDMMLGAELTLRKCRWAKNIVLEYLYTKYQSGPVYHDHNPGLSDHVGGIDDYYNHYVYPGWQHWGEAIGNPLYYSPIHNDDDQLMFESNRFMAFHVGISGEPTDELTYRFLGTWEEGLGTYRKPFSKKEHQVSFLAEGTYKPKAKKLRGWSATAGMGLDLGGILGDNFGLNLMIRRKLIIKN